MLSLTTLHSMEIILSYAKWMIMIIQPIISFLEQLIFSFKNILTISKIKSAIGRRCTLRTKKCNKLIFCFLCPSVLASLWVSDPVTQWVLHFSRFNSWIDLFFSRQLIEYFCYWNIQLDQIDIWTLNDTKIDLKRKFNNKMNSFLEIYVRLHTVMHRRIFHDWASWHNIDKSALNSPDREICLLKVTSAAICRHLHLQRHFLVAIRYWWIWSDSFEILTVDWRRYLVRHPLIDLNGMRSSYRNIDFVSPIGCYSIVGPSSLQLFLV